MNRILVHKARGPDDKRPVLFNLAESPLAWLRAHGKISDRLFRAGEALRRDYELAGLPPSVTMQWEAIPQSHKTRGPLAEAEKALHQVKAKQRFLAAIDAAGHGLSDILWRVVCAGEKVPEAEKRLGWPARAGRLVLALALERIARYYRIA